MHIILKRVCAFLLSALCIVLCISICCVVCNHPSEEIENTVSSFYREPDRTLDVVAIGASAAGKGFYPAALWKSHGLTGYSLSVVACCVNIYPSMLTEVLAKQPQAVILVDTDGILLPNNFQTEPNTVRFWIDSMPRNRNRIESIRTLCVGTQAERFFPFARYHRNMTCLYALIPISARLVKKQVLGLRDPMKGALIERNQATKAQQSLDISNLEPKPPDTLSEKNFITFLEFCKAHEVKNVLFVDFPKTYVDDYTYERNLLYGAQELYLEQIAAEYGYPTYSYNALNNPADLDLQKDFLDTLHLCVPGAVKFTDTLGDYLVEHYTFPEKDEALIERWDADTANAY